MNEKLLPCPFCGGEAFTHIFGNEIAKGYYIACDECGANIKAFGYEAEAIEAWNRRAERTAKVMNDGINYCENCEGYVEAPMAYCPYCGCRLEWK